MSLAYPSGEEGDILLVQMTTTCLEEGEGESVPCGYTAEFKGKMMNLKKKFQCPSPIYDFIFFIYLFFFFFLQPYFGLDFFMFYIQHCRICRPSDSTVSEDAGIEPRTVATFALAVRRSNHFISVKYAS